MSPSKAILFLAFRTVQKIRKGLTLQTFLCFLPIKDSFQLKRVSLTEEGNTHETPKREKNIFHKVLVFTQWRSDLWIPHLYDKDNTYLLKPNPSFGFGPKLKLFPTRPPNQRSLLLAAHRNSK